MPNAPVQEYAQVTFRAPHAKWPFIVSPYYCATDFPWQGGIGASEGATGFVCDYDLQCIYPSPLVVPHNTGDGGYELAECDPSLPTAHWLPHEENTAQIDYRCNHPYGHREFHIVQDAEAADSSLFGVQWTGATQGMTFLWAREEQSAQDSIAPEGRFTTFRIGVGDYENTEQVVYSVRFTGNGEVVVAVTYDDGVTWEDLEKIAAGGDVWSMTWGEPIDNPDAPAPPEEEVAPYKYNVLEFRLLAGRLSIRVGTQDQVFTFDEARVDAEGNAIWQINTAQMWAYKFRTLACSGHPMKWKNAAVWKSTEITTGFYSEAILPEFIDTAGVVPPEWTGFVNQDESSLLGPTVYYQLELNGPINGTYESEAYSDFTPAVRAVNLFWQAVVDSYFGPPLLARPESIDVAHQFDAHTLQIHSSAHLIFNNNKIRQLPTGEVGFWGEWMMNYGQNALEIDMGRSLPNGFIGPPTRVFTGYGHTEGEVDGAAGESKFHLKGRDRSIQLQGPRFALPWADAWNSYYFVHFIAQLWGVAKQDCAFAPYIPDIPFGPGSDLGTPEGGPAYYLPIGVVGSVLSRIQGGDEGWSALAKFARSIGYMLFFDVFGKLHFERFWLPIGIKRAFYESDAQSGFFGNASTYGGGPAGFEGCWNLKVGKSMDQVRSEAIVMGLAAFTPLWDTIVFKYDDPGVVYNPNAFNHLGYRNASVLVDSQFADLAYAQRAARQMIRWFRIPGIQSRLVTWLQPDIYPLDVILVQSQRFGSTAIPLMVTSVDHHLTTDSGSTTIGAAYVPRPETRG